MVKTEGMNYFDQLAERQLTGAQKAKERWQVRTEQRRVEKASRVPTALEKKMEEQAELAKLYRAWRRALRDKIVEQHGADFKALMRVIYNLEWSRAEEVVQYVEQAQWLKRADEDTKHATLNYIDASFERSRVRHGLPPIDDGLPGEEPSPSIKCRKLLFGF